MKIITWNCNGIRARFPLIKKLINSLPIDILCLQETKISDDIFPVKEFQQFGFMFQAYRGEKGYNGVAILSKLPFKSSDYKIWAGKEDCRHIQVNFSNDLIINNFYVPAGGDIADKSVNEKFEHKLRFLSELKSWAEKLPDDRKEILLGDLNIAPLPEDVWSHKQLINVVSHTPIEVEYLNGVLKSGNYTDIVREYYSPTEKLFSWWSYRSKDWKLSNRGRRLDHIWASNKLKNKSKEIQILKEKRGWNKPSDHVPIYLDLEI